MNALPKLEQNIQKKNIINSCNDLPKHSSSPSKGSPKEWVIDFVITHQVEILGLGFLVGTTIAIYYLYKNYFYNKKKNLLQNSSTTEDDKIENTDTSSIIDNASTPQNSQNIDIDTSSDDDDDDIFFM